jgi:streptogramin lyase
MNHLRSLLGLAIAAVLLMCAAANAATVRVVRTIALGDEPNQAVSAFGSVWAADSSHGDLVRVDPASGRIQGRIATGGAPTYAVASAHDLWVSDSFTTGESAYASLVVEIDPTTDRIVRRIHTGLAPNQLTVSRGQVWVAVHGSEDVERIAPNGRVRHIAVQRIGAAPPPALTWSQGPFGIAVVGGLVWTGGDEASAVFGVDPTRRRVVQALPIDGEENPCGEMHAAGTMIWVSAGGCGSDVWRIDTRHRRLQTIHLGSIPAPGATGSVAIVGTAVWLTTDAGQLVRIDRANGRVVGRYRLPDHLGAGSLTATGGALWLVDAGDLNHGHGRLVELARPTG